MTTEQIIEMLRKHPSHNCSAIRGVAADEMERMQKIIKELQDELWNWKEGVNQP